MKLIREYNESVKYLVESPNEIGKEKSYFIEGVFLQGEIKNRNGRVYPMDVMSKEVQRYTKEYIEKNRAYGELGHPDSPTINLDRVSHMIKELRLEGNNYVGKAKIMDTPYGKIVKSLIDEGANLGVSSRGMGSLRQRNDGTQLVQDDFMLATAGDIVADPSAPDAFVRGVMEGKEWMFVDGKFIEKDIEQVRKEIAKTSKIALAEAQAIQFAKFLEKIK
ncbi:primosomal protein [bacterium]|nr:primosomal protein [Candidatus Elulimicrobium humile]